MSNNQNTTESLEIYKPGQEVKISDFTAIIDAAVISRTGIKYDIVWWNGRTRTLETVDESEISCGGPKLKIGFKND